MILYIGSWNNKNMEEIKNEERYEHGKLRKLGERSK